MAIDDLLDEHEQGERVRNWLRNNGAGLLGGIALGLAVIFGWKWWVAHREARQQAGYAAFEQARKAIADGKDLKTAQARVQALASQDNPIYAQTAALLLARAQIRAGEPEQALATLKAVPADSPLAAYAKVRQARLLAAAGKPEQAASLLEGDGDASALEARADALAQAGKLADARDLYFKALAGMDIASPQRGLITVKLIHAGGTPPESPESI
ncbi:MAG: tetratricopeptide repeat protein [Pseudoxanthomonas sp.]